ncbi:hypothetical protein EBN03_07705 [Nocardia stercoris]|uniref:Glycosyltransferase RgtA/B/C/D-like domain-containing protein n=1 Tax=Nocardia stercoris TaxID=2483361 RepID=A0A3M2LBJ9_9NOCA|nr:hypothetical protein EBN03_07705 [Nocardia stercoris]
MRTPVAWWPVLTVAAVAAGIHLAVATRYGWHRDEFYYVICGRHPDWGYVDQPPLAPLLARLLAAMPGGLFPLRAAAVAAQLGCVLLTAALAAEFGGRRRAQLIAAGSVAAAPGFVASSLLFGTTVLDQLVWAVVLVLVVRALRLGTVRAWLPAGVAAGIGLEIKDTVAVLILGIAVGLMLFRRSALRTPGPWLAAGVTVLFAVPNLVWDARHQWANLRMAETLSRNQGGFLGAAAHLPILLFLLAGPPLVALWIAGVRRLGATTGHRWVLATVVTAVALCTAGGGKSYYALPVLFALFASGAVAVEQAATARGRVGWPLAVGLSGLVAVLIGLPVLPPHTAAALRPIDPQVVETYGWPDFVDQVAAAAAPLPPDVPIFTSNYGEAGALTTFGPSHGLHRPVYSAHNNYLLWGPPPGTPDTVLCVGEWKPPLLQRFWSQVSELAPITAGDGVTDEETAAHAAIYLCERPRGTWAELWPGLRHLD